MEMELQQQISVLKTGATPLNDEDFNTVFELFKERINTRDIEGSLLIPHSLRRHSQLDDVTHIMESLLEHGFIRFEWVFWDNDDAIPFEDLEEEDEVYLVEQMNKSESAVKEYERYTDEYEEHCGRIYHPETGTEGFDPLEHLGKQYYFTDKLKMDLQHVKPTSYDKEQAMRELFPAELMPEVEKRAREIAMERLGL